LGPQEPLYLSLAPDPAFVQLHLPADLAPGSTAVLLCPPFGWDDVCSYRSRRTWAQALAAAGHPVARIDLPGSGDSAGSPSGADRLAAWIDAVTGASSWLRLRTGSDRVAAVGIGLGGLVACAALSAGAEIDDLVLWAVPARGRAFVRELHAFAQMETGSPPADAPLVVAGFLLSDQTAATLERLDLTAAAIPGAERRRFLLLERDGLAPDGRLREHLERAGAEVLVEPGEGYAAMMDDPRLARPPVRVIDQSIAWLAARPGPAPGGASPATKRLAPRASAALELRGEGDVAIRETPVTFELTSGRVFGVLCEPAGEANRGVCGVLLGAGAIRRIGPSRMWVEVARAWAARGVPTLRVDLRGIGDADGDERRYISDDEYYRPELTAQTLEVIGQLAARALPDRFVLGGLCSGAYWSFRAAVADERVVGALLTNLWAFFWSPQLVREREIRRAHVLLRRRENIERAIPTVLRAAARAPVRAAQRRSRASEIDDALDLLDERGTQVLLQFSQGEDLLSDLGRGLERLTRRPSVELDLIPTADHTFRALALQRHVAATYDRTLDRVLSAMREP